MTEHTDPLAEASDPLTTAERLAELAQTHPETRALISVHPNSYDGLREWIAQYPAEPVAPESQPVAQVEVAHVEPERALESGLVEPAAAPVDGTVLSSEKRWHPGVIAAVIGGVVVLVIIIASIGAANSNSQRESVAYEGELSPSELNALEDEREQQAADDRQALADEFGLESGSGTGLVGDWQFSNPAGFSYTTTLSVHVPVRPTAEVAHPSDSAFIAGQSCSIDPESDLVVPVSLVATATTSEFDTPISVSFIVSGGHASYGGTGVEPSQSDQRLEIEQQFSSGNTCTTVSSAVGDYLGIDKFGVEGAEPTAEGGRIGHDFFVIIHDYYLPVQPKGDTALLDFIAVIPVAIGSYDAPNEVYTEVGSQSAASPTRLTLSGKLVGD